MKSRLLTTTAALSVALTSFQPIPVSAQEGRPANCIAENPADCPPRQRGEKRSGEGEAQQERRNREPEAARQQQERREEQKREKRAQPEDSPGRGTGAERPAGQQRQQRAQPDEAPAGRAPDAERPAGQQRERARPDEAPGRSPEAERPRDADGSDRQRRAAPSGDDAGRAPETERPADRERPRGNPAGELSKDSPDTPRNRAGEGGTGDEAPRANRAREGGGTGPDGDELRRRLEEDRDGATRDADRRRPGIDRPENGEQRDRPRARGDAEADGGDRPTPAGTIEGPETDADRARRDRVDPDRPVADDSARPRDRDTRDADRRPRDQDGAGEDQIRSPEERRANREEARRSLARALDEERPGREAAAAAADARESAEDARRAARRAERITEDDFRSSREEFRTRADDWRAGEDDDDDDDGGLSNFEKFGLLALGGLAVGALLNNNRDEVVSNSGDRVVVQRADGTYTVLKDDDTLLRRPGSEVVTQTYDDGSTRSVVTREDGTQIVTIRDAAGRVLRRTAVDGYGREVMLIDDLAPVEQIDFSRLPEPAPVYNFTETRDETALREALEQVRTRDLGRSYSLRQIRDYREVRELAPAIDVDQITFDSGSAAIPPEEAEKLALLGQTISDMIADRPEEVFLIEGHTDAVGSAASNLTLSDRRAESVALALTEYYDVPPENLVVQGYGEEDLRVDTENSDERNRRVAVRLITPLLQTASN